MLASSTLPDGSSTAGSNSNEYEEIEVEKEIELEEEVSEEEEEDDDDIKNPDAEISLDIKDIGGNGLYSESGKLKKMAYGGNNRAQVFFKQHVWADGDKKN